MPGTLSRGGNILYAWLIGPTLTPVSVAANTTAEQSFTIPGLQLNDNVQVNYWGTSITAPAGMIAGIGIVNCRVSAKDTLQIGFANATVAGVIPSAGIYQICICRPETWPLPTTAG